MIKNRMSKVLLIIILCGNILIPSCNLPDSTNQIKNQSNPEPSPTPKNSPTPTKPPVQEQTSITSYTLYLGDFHVSLDGKTEDPNDVPGELNWLMHVERTITIKDDPFRIEFPYPWVSVSGEINPDGSITATGSGTVEDGNPFTTGTFKGYITPDLIEGVYILQLPGEQPVVFRVSGVRKKKEATPTPTNTPIPASDDSEQACAVFEDIEIQNLVVRHMRDCKPTLNFHYMIDVAIPGLVSESPIDLDYTATVNGKQGTCFIEEGYDDRLYCRIDISADEAYTLGHFELFANPCQEPISVLDQTLPMLEGCEEYQTAPEENETETEETEYDS